MKAICYINYGSPDVLQLKDIDRPIPKNDELLVKVRAASVNSYDWHYLTGLPYLMRMTFGLTKPGGTGPRS